MKEKLKVGDYVFYERDKCHGTIIHISKHNLDCGISILRDDGEMGSGHKHNGRGTWICTNRMVRLVKPKKPLIYDHEGYVIKDEEH